MHCVCARLLRVIANKHIPSGQKPAFPAGFLFLERNNCLCALDDRQDRMRSSGVFYTRQHLFFTGTQSQHPHAIRGDCDRMLELR